MTFFTAPSELKEKLLLNINNIIDKIMTEDEKILYFIHIRYYKIPNFIYTSEEFFYAFALVKKLIMLPDY